MNRRDWYPTGIACFPWLGFDGVTPCILRINDFPDHPLWTLFVAGARVRDFDDNEPSWSFHKDVPSPHACEDIQRALDAVVRFEAYGSEVGRACDGLYCCFGLARG
jgi:hypothetical protein